MTGPQSATRQLRAVHERSPALLGPYQVLRNAWRSRFLMWSFMRRDLQVRFRNSILGYFWSLVEPLMLTAVYYVLFTVIAHRPEPQYPLWVLIGVLVWQLFSAVLGSSVNCLTSNAGLIKQIYFPREIFPLAAAGSRLIIAALSLMVAVPFLIYFGSDFSLYILLVPAGLLLALLVGLGVGMAAASANTVQRDITHLFNFVMRAGMFLSPVLWTIEQVPPTRDRALDLLLYNPVAVPIAMVRAGMQGQPLPERLTTFNITYSICFCIGSFLIGAMIFKKFETEVVKHL